MITGDHPRTARAIAAQAGIESEGVLTGDDMAAMDAKTVARKMATVNVFARVRPQQKLQMVNALKAPGEVVVTSVEPPDLTTPVGVAMARSGQIAPGNCNARSRANGFRISIGMCAMQQTE